MPVPQWHCDREVAAETIFPFLWRRLPGSPNTTMNTCLPHLEMVPPWERVLLVELPLSPRWSKPREIAGPWGLSESLNVHWWAPSVPMPGSLPGLGHLTWLFLHLSTLMSPLEGALQPLAYLSVILGICHRLQMDPSGDGGS